ncbi:SDR family oxidoreductase [Salinivibrio kushneri]|uniref:SDR family oxidoreductase n=1 Tax=Salinivibrio kushneri TaxID=1908198 RepID=UPI0022B3208C|nr:SDR family oxidoreductase [Salinivibrio kushneri]WBA12395.1 SDR family oxidoreductase [Salinivibrio kushneri]
MDTASPLNNAILITGCSTGIGYACAKALHEQGHTVIASCRKPDDVSRLQREGLTCIQLDVSDTASINQAVEAVEQMTGGKLFALFNNGAYGQPGALEDLPTDALRAQFETNVFGWHHLTQALLPMLLNYGEGRIVQNSSVLGIVALKYRGAYNASKFALEGWTDTLRLELSDTPIKMSLIEPGPIETAFRANALSAFKHWVDPNKSRHQQAYQAQLDRLAADEGGNKYTLPADALVAPLTHALFSPRPKIRYRVTQPTVWMAILKRLLPSRWLDRVLLKGG